ncbi:pyocin knob domain-containing protein [Lactococcus lactis]|mgnify:CR=1 FL=1|uniref:pyocin knob domain-containing protein n=1 Tax=Lactococcus lactis TaxID=1358 RepID=UPI000CE4C6F4|nr:pyocin knob domain-containing protein [Lactococcus lactis]PPA67044.1 hypothetical protein C3952_09070 [Lactococcus lactis]DAL92588.1 MAG TPA: Receptor Binding Protein [Caudoviricetes sp.]
MAVWAFPFVSANGDRAYGPADWMQFYANIFSTGIVPNTGLPGYTGFQVVQTDTPSLNINVGSGVAIIKGGQIMNTAPKSFQVPAPLTSQARTDSLVIQWNNSSRSGDVIYKTNSTQVTQTADVYELQIATIIVPANASSIAQSNITDTRADTKVCGYSSPYESIKTGDLLAQFKSELEANGVVFSEWFESIKGQLSEDAAGNLQNQINTSIHDGGEIPEGTDLNEFVNPGFYFSAGLVPDSTITNLPLEVTAAFWGQVINYKNEKTGAFRQVIFDNDSGAEYQRSSNGANTSGWGEWQKFITANKDGVVNIKDLEVTGKITQNISASISFPIGYGANVNARRTGNLVEILFSGQNSTQIAGGATMNEKIPDGFKPADVTSIDFLTPGRHLDTYYYFSPDGKIQYSGETLPANSYLRGVRTYFTADPWPAEI